jgi:hypothetical protein
MAAFVDGEMTVAEVRDAGLKEAIERVTDLSLTTIRARLGFAEIRVLPQVVAKPPERERKTKKKNLVLLGLFISCAGAQCGLYTAIFIGV